MVTGQFSGSSACRRRQLRKSGAGGRTKPYIRARRERFSIQKRCGKDKNQHNIGESDTLMLLLLFRVILQKCGGIGEAAAEREVHNTESDSRCGGAGGSCLRLAASSVFGARRTGHSQSLAGPPQDRTLRRNTNRRTHARALTVMSPAAVSPWPAM